MALGIWRIAGHTLMSKACDTIPHHVHPVSSVVLCGLPTSSLDTPHKSCDGRVSKVEMAAPMALIYTASFPSISTFETPPFCGSQAGQNLRQHRHNDHRGAAKGRPRGLCATHHRSATRSLSTAFTCTDHPGTRPAPTCQSWTPSSPAAAASAAPGSNMP